MSEPSIGLTAERLKQLLSYDPETGKFTWLVNRPSIGRIAGAIDTKGHAVIRIDGRLYRAGRLAWLYMTGAWPEKQIDHANLIRSDDRWENLRPANNSQNNMNRRVRSDSRSGLKGVTWCSRDEVWMARITANGVHRHLGTFRDPDSAHAAYAHAAEHLHKDFARTS